MVGQDVTSFVACHCWIPLLMTRMCISASLFGFTGTVPRPTSQSLAPCCPPATPPQCTVSAFRDVGSGGAGDGDGSLALAFAEPLTLGGRGCAQAVSASANIETRGFAFS